MEIMQQSQDGVTVITGDSMVKVAANRTHNGFEWAIKSWHSVIEKLCEEHNAPWLELSNQLGIYQTLTVFRNNNLEEEDIDTTRLETQFIDHLEDALRCKADVSNVTEVQTS